ncbi:Uncharacterized protein SCG7086_AP_00040 [Chlamydiales bacterium SCGC AG-110-P3]|nr:Uncharacterized protein SCG7086_AP_00040 [Chlamydiales bacterium SCGC AG-110-P3]
MPTVVTVPVADLYCDASFESEVTTQALYGQNVKAVTTTGSWTHVQTADTYHGWLPTASLVKNPTRPSHVHGIAEVDTLWTHLFSAPDTTPHRPLMTLSYETQLPIATNSTNWTERWIEVFLLDSTRAWIQSGDLRLNPSPRTLSQTIDLAYKFLGLPYRWGGCSGFGYDCSGFIQMLYRQMGYLLPRDASQQATVADAEEVTAYEPGNLIFFANRDGPISHVGMIIDSTRFIHAVTTGHQGPRTIQITNLDAPEWKPRIASVRRYSLLNDLLCASASTLEKHSGH